MDELNTDKRISAYFDMLERKFFPDGKLTLVSSNPVTPEELQQTKSAACDAVLKFLPGKSICTQVVRYIIYIQSTLVSTNTRGIIEI